MTVLVTGSDGFIGRNMVAALENRGDCEILCYSTSTAEQLLQKYARECDIVFHLAGVTRPRDPSYFLKGNTGFTFELLNCLRRCGSKAPVVYASSVRADELTAYGLSKKAAEGLIEVFADERLVPVYIYRLTNVFGKWCKPNYNSVIATFCYNIARGLPIEVDEPEKELKLVYIDDVVKEFISLIENRPQGKERYFSAGPIYTASLEYIEKSLRSFEKISKSTQIPDMSDDFIKRLYATYLSYIPDNEHAYPLKSHSDKRGSFTEFIKAFDCGQVSVNISKPGITKGNHYHHTKCEKFLVVSGHGIIRLRRPDTSKIEKYEVSGDDLRVVVIPPGFIHDIKNTGDTDMVTLMWASEVFDPENQDTWPGEVELLWAEN